MSIKAKLLEEINKKAQKIRDKRVEAASNKTLESAIFEFFKNVEATRALHSGERYDRTLFIEAKRSLTERIRGYDHGTKISIEFDAADENLSWDAQNVRGVTIWWSESYIAKHNVDPSFYIDISQMLFL